MPTPTFIILADRGNLKAFTVKQTRNRGPAARLVHSVALLDAHGRFADKYTDQAGSFPSMSSPGQANAIAERQSLFAETDARIIRQLVQQITDLLREHQPQSWAFAAAEEINGAILEGMHPDLRGLLEQNLKLDLIKTDPQEVLKRFASG